MEIPLFRFDYNTQLWNPYYTYYDEKNIASKDIKIGLFLFPNQINKNIYNKKNYDKIEEEIKLMQNNFKLEDILMYFIKFIALNNNNTELLKSKLINILSKIENKEIIFESIKKLFQHLIAINLKDYNDEN